MSVHGHEHNRPWRRYSDTFWRLKMISGRPFDENGARRALAARYAVLKGHGQ